jgi:hypothetical protein
MSTRHDNIKIASKLESAMQEVIHRFKLPPMGIMISVNGHKRHSLQDLPCSENEFNAVMESQNNAEAIKIECTQLQDFKNKYSL